MTALSTASPATAVSPTGTVSPGTAVSPNSTGAGSGGRRTPVVSSSATAPGVGVAARKAGSGVAAWRVMDEPAPSPAAFVRRRWHVIGSDRHPVAAGLVARSAGLGPACSAEPADPVGTAVLLGERFRWQDNATLLDGIAAARRDGGRLVLLHTGAGGGSLLGVAAKEHPRLEVLTVELPPDPPARAVRVAVALASDARVAGTELRVEPDGRVVAPRWERVELPAPPARAPALASGRGAVLVTGGLGGLGIRVAAVLAAVHGLHPVLLDSEPATPDAAGHLARLRRLPAGATVRAADVTDAAAVAAALASVHAPILGVVHCAGILQGRPLDAFTSHDLARAQQVKVGGLDAVLAAVDRRRLRHLITFGSITARNPHRSMASYALANELLRRQTLRVAPDLPLATTVAAEWSLWSGAGMAHQAGAVTQARRMGLSPVSLRSGMAALLGLLSWPPGPAGAASLVLEGTPPAVRLPARSAG